MKHHFLYGWYVIRHKWFVFDACRKVGLWFPGLVHDLSKLLPDEWITYANFFYTDRKEREAFDVAWLKHQHRNPHHWQHWVLRNDDGTTVALEMPRRYALEMICDWMGAGRAIVGPTSDTSAWYQKNKDRIMLHAKTREFVEYTLIVPPK